MSGGSARHILRPRVVLLRGHSANPWDLRPWEDLRDRYDVRVLVTRRNPFDLRLLHLEQQRVRSLRDLLPAGRLGDLAVRLPGDRYLGLAPHLEGADIVHSAEIGIWFSSQPALLKRRLGFRLVLTVWETIPFLGTFRSPRARACLQQTIDATDLFLAATHRARQGLLLEGVPESRIRVHPPGIDRERFAAAAVDAHDEHLIVSPGRLVWEKGHRDVLRALAAIDRGLVAGPAGRTPTPRLLIVGAGPDEAPLRAYAGDLGIASRVEFRRHVSYDEMPGVYAEASCMVLASLAIPFWEEQFGMVLAEAMAAGTPIVASASGAIPEVIGEAAALFTPGDWMGLAKLLVDGPLARPAGERVAHDPERVETHSSAAAAGRLARFYEELLSA